MKTKLSVSIHGGTGFICPLQPEDSYGGQNSAKIRELVYHAEFIVKKLCILLLLINILLQILYVVKFII